MVEEDFHKGGAAFFSIILKKKKSKNKYAKVFSTESKG